MRFGSGPVFENYKQKQKITEEKKKRNNRSVSFTDRSWPVCSGESEMALAPGLSRKLKKVLESRTETPDLLASLKTLSTFYEDNTPHARRNLRSTIEKRALSINLDFLQASSAAQQVSLSLSLSYILFSLFLFVLVGFVFSMILGSGSS